MRINTPKWARGIYGSQTDWQWRVGGAIGMEDAGATIRRNKLRNNSCIGDSTSEYEASGGGIECFKLPEEKSVIIEENEFYNNIMSKFAWGGAFEFQNVHRTALVTKNTMIGNSVSSRAGAYGGAICILTGLY